MAQNVVYSRQDAAWINRQLQELVASINGTGSLRIREARSVQLVVGMTALGYIKEAFIVKAAGGTDEAGESWVPLSPRTIAYGRRHPGLNRKRRNAADKGRAARPLLSEAQNDMWKRIYGGVFNRTKNAELAARIAWDRVKKSGGKTILGEYGSTKVQVLRDTGTLLNSLSPGSDNKPSGHPNQIVRFEIGAIIVGTNRKGAVAHHFGSQRRKIPQRRLWPEPRHWPQRWWQGIMVAARDAIVQVFLQRIR